MKKRSPPNWFSLLALVLGLSACQSRPAVHDAGPSLSLASTDAGAPRALELHLEALLADGGVALVQLDPSTPAVLPVTRSLEVTGNFAPHNYRLRILDELDRALPSDDLADETDGGFRYHIALLAPLRSGHRYTVLLDAQSGATFDNGNGAPLDEERFEFRTEGEREKDAPVKGPTKHHHRRAGGS
jgi:hypothetical protein